MPRASKKSSAKDDVVVIDIKQFITPITILLSAVVVSIVLLIGLLSINSTLKKFDSYTGETQAKADTTGDTAGDVAGVADDSATVSIDDDPVLGNKDQAKVAIVEFSDYECPYCKKFHLDTFDSLIKDYVDTGKAIFVYRDFPLSFHDPLATNESLAANCVQDLGGDAKYYEFGGIMYEKTTSNGSGLTEDQLYEFAKQIGIDEGKFKTCYQSQQFKDEIAKDIKDATAAGITGTPGFIIGVLKSDGTVDGQIVSGAQPLSVFQAAIEAQLARAN